MSTTERQYIDLTRLDAEHELAELRRRLAAAEHLGDLIAHELRNLVVVLQAHSGLLAHDWDRLEANQRRRSAETIDEETTHLSELLTGLLDVGRRTHATLREVKLAPIIFDAVRATSARERGLEDIVIDCPVGLKVPVSSELVSLIVRNLVENALLHGRPPVEITAVRHGDRLRMQVDDHGPGVDPEFMPYLFERFKRADNCTPGLGLGLAIVADLVRLHGGAIRCEQRVPTGASFIFELPLG